MKYILECEKIEATPNIELKRLLFKDGYTYLISSRVASHITPYDEESAYQKGRYTAQEVYRRMIAMFDKSYGDYMELFGVKPPGHVIRDYTVDEIEQMLDDYEKRIRVGDVVALPSGSKAVVVNVHVEDVGIMYSDGSTGIYDPKYIIKTGEHISSVAETLKKLKG